MSMVIKIPVADPGVQQVQIHPPPKIKKKVLAIF